MKEDTSQNSIELEEDPDLRMRQMSRRSFLWGAVGAATMFGGYHWLNSQETNYGIPWPFRRILGLNEKLAKSYFRGYRLAPEFDPSEISHDESSASGVRENGDLGIVDEVDVDSWRLRVKGLRDMSGAVTSDDDQEPALVLTLADIKALPKVSIVTELKCIEGWSIVVKWTGARFVDFAAKYGPSTHSGKAADVINHPEDVLPYVGIETPDSAYYVGLDRESALHPQTLLCYEMNGKPLTNAHGSPLRLAIPVKYGIKNIKRIGSIRFTDKRPRDYWAEQGYDWFAGH